MSDPASSYAVRFNNAAADVSKGKRGSISESTFLKERYGYGCYSVLQSGLDHPNPNVRAETILLCSKLDVRSLKDRITQMSYTDRDVVVGACVAYLKALEDRDSRIPKLLYKVNHENGEEFGRAMRLLAEISGEREIDDIRKVYGQVDGEQRKQTREALERIIDRHPELESRRPFILSVPLYPNEADYEKFLEKSIDYLNVRYREKVFPRQRISMKMHNDVAHALLVMQTRVYNEQANLEFYSYDTNEADIWLTELIHWAADDIKKKEVIKEAVDDRPRRTSRISDY